MRARKTTHVVDRGFLLSLVVLIALGAAAVFGGEGRISLDPDASISEAYERFAGIGLQTCVLLPVYAVGVSGVMTRLGGSAHLVRQESRARAVDACVRELLLRSFAFQAVQVTFALAAALLKSGIPYSSAEVGVFAAQQLLLGTLWFAVVSLLMLAGRLIWGWGFLAVIPALIYAGYDILLSMTALTMEAHLAMGWRLVLSADSADVIGSLAGAARLTAMVLALYWLCHPLARRADFLGGGAEGESS